MPLRALLVLLLVIVPYRGALTAAPAQRAGTVRIAARPFIIDKQHLERAALKKSAGKVLPPVTRIVLTKPGFSELAAARFEWRVVSRSADVATLRGPAATAPFLGAIDGIRYVKKPSRVYPLMDTVRKYCGVDAAHGTVTSPLGRAFTGKKVLFGIIDTDFDVHHPAFIDANGSIRFLALWDQNDTTGAVFNRFGYGTIKNAFEMSDNFKFGLRGSHHGTTMASYGAGGELTVPFYGVAPDACIAGVCMGDLDNSIIDGLQWLFSLADSLGMPCVVNMSLGYHDGPHDGTSLVDRTIDTLSGPGRIVVGSAGNDGNKKAHVTLLADEGDTSGIWAKGVSRTDTSAGEAAEYGIELWGEKGRPFSMTVLLLDTTANRYYEGVPALSTDTTLSFKPDTLAFTVIGNRIDTVIVEALTESSSALNEKPHAQLLVSTNRASILPGIRITARLATAIQAWNMTKQAFVSLDMTGFIEGDTIMSVNELGGTARSNITVGAYTSKLRYTCYDGRVVDWKGDGLPWHFLCFYSSHGPTADGRIKPDITAPGSDLIGAMPRDASGGSIVLWPDTTKPTGRYWASGGTSASAPVVAGTVALMLEADSLLTPQRAKEILQATALTDSTTGTISSPNILWGAGRVNAEGALEKFLGIGVRQRIVGGASPPELRLTRLASGRYRLSGVPIDGITVSVLTLTGRTVASATPGKNGIMELPRLPPGAWIAQAIRAGKPMHVSRITVPVTWR
jgi:minor extracellular serine protease Vpr